MALEIGISYSDLTLESWFQYEPSTTGYLEDVIAGKPIRSTNQKVEPFVTYSNTAQSLHGHQGDWRKIVYPFEWMKPGGIEGETTLKDINYHILMTPSASKVSKPIPHPVENSVIHRCKLGRGFSMSGKAVSSLTRIRTKGRGSITIIRTKD